MLPIPTQRTPDERPLSPNDIAIIFRHLPNLHMRFFGFTLRIVTRVLPRNYETCSGLVRFVYDAAARFGNILLQVPGLQGLGSTVTLDGPLGTDNPTPLKSA